LALLLRIGELRYRTNDLNDAAQASRKPSLSPGSPSANFWLAIIAESKGDWPEAIKLLKSVAEKTPDPGVQLRLSYYYAQAGQKKEAIKILEGLVKDEPENVDFLNYWRSPMSKRELEAGRSKTVERAIAIDTENPEYRSLWGLSTTGRVSFKSGGGIESGYSLKGNYAMALNYLGYSYADRNTNLTDAEPMSLRP